MLTKKANCSLVNLLPIDTSSDSTVNSALIKMASHNKNDLNTGFNDIIKAEIQKHPRALFFKAKAIVADEMNSNGDYFSADELKKSFRTFIGVPFFTNHNNQDVENARGKIVWAEWNDSDNAIYVVGFVDREAYPHICRGIEEEYMNGVSMGAINGDALITMADKSEKRISEVVVGDTILSAYGNPRKVKNIHEEFLGKQMYKFDLITYHKSPLFTDDHPLFSIEKSLVLEEQKIGVKLHRNNCYARNMGYIDDFIGQDVWRNKEYPAEFRKASTINIEDYLLIPSKFTIKEGKSENSDFYYVVGAYLGDGYLRKDKNGDFHAVSFCFGKDEIELAKKTTDILKKYTKASPDTLVCCERNGLYINFYDREMAQWFYDNFGTGSKCKRIKLNLKFKEDALNLLAGYLDTDGCIAKKTNPNHTQAFQFSSANLGLLEDIQSILISLNSISRISTMDRKPSLNSVVQVNTVEHTLSIGSNNFDLFSKSIKFANNTCVSAKINAGKSFITTINNKKYMACPVKNIEVIDFQEPVYDLTVEEDENYIANGIAVHNCSVEYSICSICHNKAATPEEYCNHIKYKKGRRFTGQAKDVVTGEIKTFKDASVHEENHGIKFIELSGVADPACRSCRIKNVIKNHDFLQKAASSINNIYMYRESKMSKEAGQEEVDQLNQVLKTLEDISIKLIENRQQVDVEFASDLVKILSELQEFTDELVGAGYAQIQGGAGQQPSIPGTELPQQSPQPLPATPEGGAGAGMPIQPVSLETGAGITPEVTGAPGKPMVARPNMPSAPAKPMASDIASKIVQLSEKITKIILNENNDKNSTPEGDINDMRRIPKIVEAEQQKVMETLDKSLKEKTVVSEYNKKDSILNNNGGQKMSQKAVASRIEAPEVVTEKQLEDKTTGYHPREDSPREEITQSQLESKRTGDEKEVVTQKQLDEVRKDDEKNVVTQKQLDGVRTEDEKETVTQDQLKDGYRTNKTPEVLTEKQLEDKPGDFWLRSAFTRTSVKTAKEHIEDVIKVLAGTAIQTSATPEQIHLAVKDLTNSIKAKSSLLDNITKTMTSSEKEVIDSGSRMKYWGNKGVKLAAISKDELKDMVVAKLNTLIAKDEKVSPETTASVLEVVGESPKSVEKIASVIDSMLADVPTTEPKIENSKDEIKSLFEGEEKEAVKTASSEDAKMKRESERKEIVAKLEKKATHVIQTSLEEMNLSKEDILGDKTAAKKLIVGFTRGSCLSSGLKLAGITNVKIDEQGRVEIAISTEGEEQSVGVELPPEGDNAMPSEIPPEGDITGEGLDSMVPPVPEAGAVPEAVPPATGATTPLPPPAAKSREVVKTAQVPGAQGSAPGGIGAAPATIPGAEPDPAMAPVQSLTEDTAATEDETGLGESDSPGQFPAGSKCPFCGSDDVDVGGQGKEAGYCECNDCGAEYLMSVNIQVLNPKEMSFEEEGKKIPEPEEPELPEMPVAASIKLTKDTMVKLATLEKSKGLVCPACGQTECKAEKKTAGYTSSICPACETKFVREASVNVDKPDEAVMTVTWNIDPKKVMSSGCKSCKEAAMKFASRVKVARMLRKASTTEFPMANCIERVARKWGSNAVSTFGPCKGKPLAECVCKELQRFGFTDIKKMNKLAEAMSQKDPMDQCLEDHLGKGYKKAQAEMICNALKKKYATKVDDNIYAMAWDGEGLTDEDFDEMKSQSDDAAFEESTNVTEDSGNIGDPLPELPAEDGEDQKIVIELPKDIAEDIKDQVEEATSDVPVVEGEPAMEGATELEVSAPTGDAPVLDDTSCEKCKNSPCTCNSQAVVAKGKDQMKKEAEKPTKVENVEKEVKDMPRGDAKLGNESAENIDKKVSKPDVPEGKATMGKEGPDNIDKKMDLPDVPSGNAYMGKEKETQKGMPENNNKIKGTVVAESEKITKEAKSPETVKNMEDKVEIPRGDATMGQEGLKNIDVSTSEPKIPRGDAKMGGESAENIDKAVKNVDVPTGNAYIGKEQEVQKGMPANTVESLGTVRANDEKRSKQLERLAAARHEKACVVAAKLLGEGRITKDEMDDVIKDLSKLELDRIESFAKRIYPQTIKTANTEVLSQPVVIESRGIEQPAQQSTLKDRLESMFTPGSRQLKEALKLED